MRKIGIVFIVAVCGLSFAQGDVSGLVYKGSEYIKTSDGKSDTIKSNFQFILNVTSNFLFIKKVDGFSEDKIPFKELKVKDRLADAAAGKSLKSLGFNQSRMYTVTFPYDQEGELKPTFISWTYNALSKFIEVKISAKKGSDLINYTLMVERSQYLNWDKGIVFEKKIPVDKYVLELKGKETENETTSGFVILSDTAVTFQTKQLNESYPYQMVYKGKEGIVGYMSRAFIVGFPKPFSISDKYYQIMLDRNQETGDWERIIMFREKK